MACFRPLRAHRDGDGRVILGTPELPGRPSFCLPCGKCVGCLAERARSWALRCVHEAQMHKDNCFITLTYAPANLPADLSVCVREWQLFAKRFRKLVGPFRFLACGEYGESNYRPHYHACIFGVDLRSGGELLKRSPQGDLYTSELLSEAWGRGFVTVGELTMASASYVARYVMKKLGSDIKTEQYRRVDDVTGETWSVRPEFVTMSRGGRGGKGGIGSSWFDRYMDDIFPSDDLIHEGRRYKPPRYYTEKLSDCDLEGVKARRYAKALEHEEDNSDKRLSAREECAKARMRRLTRNI